MDSETNSGDDAVDEGLFYFESDHLALRGNKEYSEVLRAIIMLEAQRIAVHGQIEKLMEAKQRYLEDPELFLKDLKANQIYSPPLLNIVKVPDLKMTTENNSMNTAGAEGSNPLSSETDASTATSTSTSTSTADIYRRANDSSFNDNHNRLWTAEEQKRLEELLIKYPEERVDMHRFAKIAKELGNRTPLQVSSRVQKYFQKLHNAGLPIPGRAPKSRRYIQSKPKFSFRQSTFFPDRMVPVNIPDDDDYAHDICNFELNNSNAKSALPPPPLHSDNMPTTSSTNDCKNDLVSDEIQKQMITMLQTVKEEKQKTLKAGIPVNPLTPKCRICSTRPISNTCWYCQTCYEYLNYCNDCLITALVEGSFDHFCHEVIIINGR